MVEKNSVLLNLSDRQMQCLDLLKERADATRTKIMRGLIPREQMQIALEEKQIRMGQHYLSKPGGIFDIVAQMLAEEMKNDKEHPIGMQVLSREVSIEMAHNISILYLMWAKAKRGVEGYQFEKITHEQNGMTLNFWVVVHKDDSNKNVLKSEIIELAANALRFGTGVK